MKESSSDACKGETYLWTERFDPRVRTAGPPDQTRVLPLKIKANAPIVVTTVTDCVILSALVCWSSRLAFTVLPRNSRGEMRALLGIY